MISLPFQLLLMKLQCHERGEGYVSKLLDRASVCFCAPSADFSIGGTSFGRSRDVVNAVVTFPPLGDVPRNRLLRLYMCHCPFAMS